MQPRTITVSIDLAGSKLPDKRSGSWLYLIEAVGTGLVKVGMTTDIERRFTQLIGENAVELKLVGVMEGNSADERAAHDLLKAHRVHGEWFKDCEEVRKLFA